MSPAIESSLTIVAYLALFFGVGCVFLFVNLLVGWLLRPANPQEEKDEIYECGEPTIGSSFVQFDLRFYVVALLFIIFDVEVAFFFPWAVVFGKATQMADPQAPVINNEGELTAAARGLYRELGVNDPAPPTQTPANLERELRETYGANVGATQKAEFIIKEGSRKLALFSIADIAVFFTVLLVGFAYVWKRGDLDWVRAVSSERRQRAGPGSSGSALEEPALSA